MKAVLGFALVAAAIATDATPRPVTRVVNMLKDMLHKLEDDAKADQEIYDKMSCWCSNNDSGKTNAIAEEEAQINRLVARIEELTAKSAQLGAEIEEAEKNKAASIQALQEATELRKKEQADFNEDESEKLHTIDLLKGAIQTLSKHQGNQNADHTEGEDKMNLISVATNLRASLKPYQSMMAEKLTPMQMTVVTRFLQGYQDGYNNQSGEVFGVLEQLKEDTEEDLSDAQKAEMAAQQAFEKTKEAKLQEQSQLTDEIESKSSRQADADADAASSTQLLEETRNALSADQTFLMELKKKCQETDDQWDQRQKDRALEMKSVNDAIKVLNSPDAFDTFSRTLTKQHGAGIEGVPETMLVQLHEQESDESRAERASAYLKQMSRKLSNPKLGLVASSLEMGKVRNEVVQKVITMIEKLVAQLKKDQKDQEVKWEGCRTDMNDNSQNIQDTKNKKEDLEIKVKNLSSDIDGLIQEIEDHDTKIKEALVATKSASETRNAENIEFQTVYADQAATKALLKQAMEALAPAYGLVQTKNLLKQAPLDQAGATTENAAPEGFSDYKKGAGGSVMALLQQVIDEANDLQKEAVQSEQEALNAYNEFVANTATEIKDTRKMKATCEKSKAAKETEKAATEDDLKATNEELLNLEEVKTGLGESCNWLIKNFQTAQEARAQEMNAFKNAAAILKGA